MIYKRDRDLLRNQISILMDWMSHYKDLFSCVIPKAGGTAFSEYIHDMNSRDFCSELLREEDVLLAPGDFFGGPEHFRIAYVQKPENLKEGLNALARFAGRRA